jgi:hypothetical protein
MAGKTASSAGGNGNGNGDGNGTGGLGSDAVGRCFSIIGSERTVSIELEDAASRDMVVFRLQLFMRQWHTQHPSAGSPLSAIPQAQQLRN